MGRIFTLCDPGEPHMDTLRLAAIVDIMQDDDTLIFQHVDWFFYTGACDLRNIKCTLRGAVDGVITSIYPAKTYNLYDQKYCPPNWFIEWLKMRRKQIWGTEDV